MANKMKVEIWSDIVCPFCYIGKRKFEQALQQANLNDVVDIEWRSYQLDPNVQAKPGKDIYTYLAEAKGQNLAWSRQVHEQVTNTARAVGLAYNFDTTVIANSFNAHRLIQLAKKHGKGDAMEEALFRAYFTDGRDINNHVTLTALGEEIGLDKEALQQTLAGNSFSNDVNNDIAEANEIGVRGVPFFVFDRKYAVAGAQSAEVFTQLLNKSFAEWKEKHPLVHVDDIDGNACTTTGDCL